MLINNYSQREQYLAQIQKTLFLQFATSGTVTRADLSAVAEKMEAFDQRHSIMVDATPPDPTATATTDQATSQTGYVMPVGFRLAR